LISGSGTNLQAILDAAAKNRLGGAQPAVVISNNPEAGGLLKARGAGIDAVVIDHKSFPDRDRFEAKLVEELTARQIDLVVLAGFMRLLGARFLTAFEGRIINIHPSLLPSFPGTHAQRQALARGVKVSGCTVHFVDAGTDTGPIIAQGTVEVLDGDDEATLAARILAVEHRIFPEAIRAIAEGRVTREHGRVRVRPAAVP
jgi:phosphoribosylglycinamide formyltransferase-1